MDEAKMIECAANLMKEGFLSAPFMQLLSLPGSPTFVSEIVALYLTDYEKMLNQMMLHTSDIDKVEFTAMELKGSSLSIGIPRVTKVCEAILQCCKKKDENGVVEGVNQLKEEYAIIKSKLEQYLLL